MKKFIAGVAIILSMFVANVKTVDARPKMQTIKYAINLNWCGHIKKSCTAGREAFSVAGCETGYTYNIWAGVHKHQYWGLFQMGSFPRSRYGHGWNAWDQADAAHKYYVASGRDWSPWQCRPGGHLAW